VGLNSMWILAGGLGVFALAYRYYSAFLSARVVLLDPDRETPAHRLHDGRDYVPTNRWVLFGHHFAAISGAGPLLGPVLATQFGYAPGAIWIIFGAVLAGAVHDFIALFASVRHDGKSLSHIARLNISKLSGGVTSVAVLFIITTALAGLAIAVVKALANSPWGTFTIAATIPAALLVGLYLHVLRPGRVAEASVIGVTLVLLGVILGHQVQASSWAPYFVLSEQQLKLILPAYGFIASVLPVWMLLCPRDYLSSYMKIGTVALLAVGIALARPVMHMPALTQFIHGGGPVLPGTMWPFVCINIMCGAISGFHSLIGSGTTPKMIDNERDIRMIGYGAMLVEGFVALMALIAAATLQPGDYFAINTALKNAAAIPAWAAHQVHLPELTRLVGEQTLVGRTGGAVSLAVGMADIFAKLPGMKTLLAYWYHYVIMFEALFILTAVDTGTRVARFIVQEAFFSRDAPGANRSKAVSWTVTVVASGIACLAWGYLLYNNDITTIWPMFGVANQLLAAVALAIGTTIILRTNRARYALVTFLPLCFILVTTLDAGWQNMAGYLAKGTAQDHLNLVLTGAMMVMVVVITADAARVWLRLLRGEKASPAAANGSE